MTANSGPNDDGADGRPGTAIVIRDATVDHGANASPHPAVRRGHEQAVQAMSELSFRDANERLLRDNERLARANADLRRANEDLLLVRRLEEEFIGVVAHELRTPLTALRGYLQLLDGRHDDDFSRPLLPLAIEQADRLQRLVDELFDVTRVERGALRIDPEPLDLCEVVEEAIEIASSASDGHRIRFDRPTASVIASVDRVRMQQVLLNLLMNALVHAPGSPEIDVRLRKLRRRAEVDVEDRGPGIPRERQEQIFGRFEQGGTGAGRNGLGLGLYIARAIVVAHGGSIDVDSAPGKGTTFTVRLPLRAGAVKPTT